MIESQVEILQSEAIAGRVVDKLGLDKDSDFNGQMPGKIVRSVNNVLQRAAEIAPEGLRSFFLDHQLKPPPRPALPPEVARRIAVRQVIDSMKVVRSARTYVLNLSFTATNPEKAANIANGLADAFLVDQLEVQYDQTKRAAVWLASRLDAMQKIVEESERKVENYRAESNLTQANGKLISDQQLQEADTQLTVARARVAETRAKLEQTKAIDLAGTDPSALPEVTSSEAITRLKTQYADVARNAADLSNRYGANHPLVRGAEQQLAQVRSSLDGEIKRIAESYRNEFDVAVAREHSLEKTFAEIQKRNAELSQAQIRLRELEREASSNRAIYERFLNRYKEMSGNEALPSPDARILAYADVATSPSGPKSTLAMILSTLAGLVAGLGLAFSLEHVHAGLRTRRQLEDMFGLQLLTLIPYVRARSRQMASYAAQNPLSNYAEAIRSIRMAIHLAQISGNAKVIAVVSALPAEGKSTTALNLANYAASTGTKTLLIDADMRRPTASKMLGKPIERGLGEVLRNEASLSDVIQDWPNTGLKILPSVRNAMSATLAPELLSSERMAKLVDECRRDYDFIVVDASPLIPVVDARALINLVDKVVFVTEWNKTSRFVVAEALELIGGWRDNILGVVLNKTDMRRLHHYEQYNSKSYANRYPDYYGSKR